MAFNSCVSVTTPAPLAMTIPASQWSGSGSDYYITVSASNITADSILIPHYDEASAAYLNGLIWCVPAAGSFTIHTSAIPSGTITVLIQFAGTNGDAQYQVLADVYSTSQALAKADVVDGLTSTATNVPLSANQGKILKDRLEVKTITSGDLDDITETGYYFINAASGVVANSPAGYSNLIVLCRNGAGCGQICFTKTEMYHRAYSGSPAAWGAWTKIAPNDSITKYNREMVSVSGYDTTIMSSVSVLQYHGCVQVNIGIKSGLSGGWNTAKVTNLPDRFKPHYTVYGSHSIGGSNDANTPVFARLNPDGTLDMYAGSTLNNGIPFSFTYPYDY